MRTRALPFVLATLVAAPSLTLPAREVLAQAPTSGMDPDTKEAKTLFDDGVKLYKAGKYEEARVKFKAAYGLKRRPSIGLNLANAELQTKRPLEALVHFRDVVAMPEAKPEDREEAKQGIVEARKQVGTVFVEATIGTTVTVDGEPRTVNPDGSLELLPGAHVIVLRGEKETTEKVTLVAGQTITVRPGGSAPPVVATLPAPTPEPLPAVEPPPAPAPAPPPATPQPFVPPPSPPADRSTRSGGVPAVTWVGAGLTAVALAGWIGFAVTANRHDSNAQAYADAIARPTCSPGVTGPCTSASNKLIYRDLGLEQIDKASNARTLAWISGASFFVIGGATLASYFLLREPERRVAVAATPTVGGAEITLMGRF
jgi:hypothetical protein